MQLNRFHIHEVTDKGLLKTFIQLPASLYKDEERWVPPLYVDEYKFHDPKQNFAFEHATVARWIVYEAKKPVGRIMGIVPHQHNQLKGECTARFYQFDCINDQTVADLLMITVIKWAKENGMNRLIGPFGFSDKDPQGVQIEGFEYLPVIATPTNPAYLPNLIINAGFQPYVDCVSYRIPIPHQLPPIYERIVNRVNQQHSFKLLEFSNKSALKKYIIPVFELVNETYADLFGFIPMKAAEMEAMAKQYMPILNPSFVKLVVNEQDELIAFVIAMPDMSKGLQQAKGRLWPFGFIHLLWAMRNTNQLNLLLGAVRASERGKGLDVLMGIALMKSASAKGFTVMDSHLVLENNRPMRAEYEKLGGELYKRYRVFARSL